MKAHYYFVNHRRTPEWKTSTNFVTYVGFSHRSLLWFFVLLWGKAATAFSFQTRQAAAFGIGYFAPSPLPARRVAGAGYGRITEKQKTCRTDTKAMFFSRVSSANDFTNAEASIAFEQLGEKLAQLSNDNRHTLKYGSDEFINGNALIPLPSLGDTTTIQQAAEGVQGSREQCDQQIRPEFDVNEASKELIHYSKMIFFQNNHRRPRRTAFVSQEARHSAGKTKKTDNAATGTSIVFTEDETPEIAAAKNRIFHLLAVFVTVILKKEHRNESKGTGAQLSINSAHNVLVSLSYLVQLRGQISMRSLRWQPLIQNLWRQLEEQQGEKYLCPRRWLECLQAATILQLEIISPLFYAKVCHRLTKGDALARLKPNQLVQALAWSGGQCRQRPQITGVRNSEEKLAERGSMGNEDLAARCCQEEIQLFRSVMKRLRKQNVRQQTGNRVLTNAIGVTVTLLGQQKQNQFGVNTNFLAQQKQHETKTNFPGKESNDNWEGELRKLSYTLLHEKIQRLDGDHNLTINTVLSSEEMATMFVCANHLVANATDPMVHQLCMALESNTTFHRLTFAECSSIFQVLSHWRHSASSRTVQKMGEALLTYRPKQHESVPTAQELNSILRGVFLLHRTEKDSLLPYRNLAERFFQNKDFLANCSLGILPNFIWFASSARLSDCAAAALVNQTLETLQNNLDLVSPKVACRILNSLTPLFLDRIQYKGKDNSITTDGCSDSLFQIFASLGIVLSTARLHPYEISSALVSFAKVGCTQDSGAIHHMAAMLVMRLEDSSFRHVAQSLWALAKINELDNGSLSSNGEGGSQAFLKEIYSLTAYLSSHSSQLSTKDISQTIWALAKLELYDEAFIVLWDPLLVRIESVGDLLTAQQISNCLWALSKLPRKPYNQVYKLTQLLRNEPILESLKPQEATAILYALGRMDIRDEWIFGQLSQVILSEVESSSSPAITRILWAHNVVHLNPPQDILDAWASKKLGIMPVSIMSDD